MNSEIHNEINLTDEDLPENWSHPFGDTPEIRHVDAAEMAKYLKEYRKRRAKLIAMAARASAQAVSHRPRPFRVGSAVLTVGEKQDYRAVASHNWTPSSGKRTGGDKRCAERNAIDIALLADNRAFIVALTTVSQETSTGDHPQTHDVLHPCQECRMLLRQMIAQGHLADESILCSVNDANSEHGPEPIIEESTVRHILDTYHDDPVT